MYLVSLGDTSLLRQCVIWLCTAGQPHGASHAVTMGMPALAVLALQMHGAGVLQGTLTSWMCLGNPLTCHHTLMTFLRQSQQLCGYSRA